MNRTRGLLCAAFAAALVLVVAAPSFAEGESCTQGYFATLFCDRANLDPNKEWSPEDAITRLKELGIEPLDGWKPEEAMTEGQMVLLLRFVDIPVFSSHPDRIVTVLEARAVFDRFGKWLIETMPAMMVVDEQSATTIDGETHIAPPLSQ